MSATKRREGASNILHRPEQRSTRVYEGFLSPYLAEAHTVTVPVKKNRTICSVVVVYCNYGAFFFFWLVLYVIMGGLVWRLTWVNLWWCVLSMQGQQWLSWCGCLVTAGDCGCLCCQWGSGAPKSCGVGKGSCHIVYVQGYVSAKHTTWCAVFACLWKPRPLVWGYVWNIHAWRCHV